MKLIERIFYLDKLKDVMETADIKVITGVRRSGKSKLLEAFMEYVRQADTAVYEFLCQAAGLRFILTAKIINTVIIHIRFTVRCFQLQTYQSYN